MNDFVELVYGAKVLIAAIGALIVAVAALVAAFPPIIRRMLERLFPWLARPRLTPIERLEQLTARLEKDAQAAVGDRSKLQEVSQLVRRTTEELVMLVRTRVPNQFSDDTVYDMAKQILEGLQGLVMEGVSKRFRESGARPVGGAVTELLEDPKTLKAIDRAIDRRDESRRLKRKRWSLSVSVSLSVVSSLLFWVYLQPGPRDTRSMSEVYTTKAFLAFEKGKWKDAKEYAQQCIGEFGGLARRRQAELQTQKAPLPNLHDLSEQNKQRIFQEGLVNDVAASYWILGRASEKLGETDAAIAAHTQAATFTYAAVWDPKGWFFFPGQDAAARLEELRAKTDHK